MWSVHTAHTSHTTAALDLSLPHQTRPTLASSQAPAPAPAFFKDAPTRSSLDYVAGGTITVPGPIPQGTVYHVDQRPRFMLPAVQHIVPLRFQLNVSMSCMELGAPRRNDWHDYVGCQIAPMPRVVKGFITPTPPFRCDPANE